MTKWNIFLLSYLSGSLISGFMYLVLLKNFDWHIKMKKTKYFKRLWQLKKHYINHILLSWLAIIMQVIFYLKYRDRKKKEVKPSEETTNNKV